MKRKHSFLMVMILILMGTLACTEAETQMETSQVPATSTVVKAEPIIERTLVVAQNTDTSGLDPQRAHDSFSISIFSNIFDTLIYRSIDLKLEPGLATKWEAIDETTWEITLREGVKFHNGDDFTAADVKYTLERPLDPDLNSPLAGRFSVLAGVDIIDDYTVHIKTKAPYPLLAPRLSEWFILSKDYYENTNLETLFVEPMGTGAYKVVDWVVDEQLTLSANEDYWQGPVAVKDVIFRPIPDATKRLMALQAGDVDIITNIPPDVITTLEESPHLEARLVPSTYIQYVALDATKNPILADVRVRQAIQYATDVPTLLESIFNGAARQISIPLAHGTFGYDDSLAPYPYDLEKAKSLLAEAGYPDGIRFTLDAPVDRYPQDKETVTLLKEQWAKAGIMVDLNLNEWSVQLSKYRSEEAKELAEAHFMGWGTSTFDADDILFGAFANQPNRSHYTNKQVIDLVTQARNNMNPAQREALYSEALHIIYEEVPWLFLFQQFEIYGISSDITWRPRPDQKIEVGTITFKNGD